jgi:hypothetical protein
MGMLARYTGFLRRTAGGVASLLHEGAPIDAMRRRQTERRDTA